MQTWPQTLLPLEGAGASRKRPVPCPCPRWGSLTPSCPAPPDPHPSGLTPISQAGELRLSPGTGACLPQAGLRAGAARGSLTRPLPVRLLLCSDVQNETLPVLGEAVGHRLPKPGSRKCTEAAGRPVWGPPSHLERPGEVHPTVRREAWDGCGRLTPAAPPVVPRPAQVLGLAPSPARGGDPSDSRGAHRPEGGCTEALPGPVRASTPGTGMPGTW